MAFVLTDETGIRQHVAVEVVGNARLRLHTANVDGQTSTIWMTASQYEQLLDGVRLGSIRTLQLK